MTPHGEPALDLRALAEALADVLAERGLVAAATSYSARVLDAAEVADLLGRDRHWVYDDAEELGAFRYGDGPKAAWICRVSVERWKCDRAIRRATPHKTPAGAGLAVAPSPGGRISSPTSLLVSERRIARP